MIIITSRLFDAEHSPVVLDEDRGGSDLDSIARRLSRTATLDGGAVIDDAGYSDGDRTIDVLLPQIPDSQLVAIKALIEADGIQRLATVDGVFDGGISRLTRQRDGNIALSYLVREKLSF